MGECVDVVAAVIERRGRLLLARRPLHKPHGGLWEFPGGKVDPAESLAAALERELSEELALTAVRVDPVLEVVHHSEPPSAASSATAQLRLHFMRVHTSDAPIALEHMALGWYRQDEALGLELAPLDRQFLSLWPGL